MTRTATHKLDEDQLWEKYWHHGHDERWRNLIAERYIYLIEREARVHGHIPSAQFDQWDLRQVAAIGLLAAIERWNPERNNNFEAWATFRIRKDIAEALRTTADPLSRTLRSQAREIDQVTEDLRQRYRVEPDAEAIAEMLDISTDELRRRMGQIHSRPTESLEGHLQWGDSVLDAGSSTEDDALAAEMADRLRRALDAIDGSSRSLLVRLYLGEETLVDISRSEGVSRAVMRNRHAMAFDQLRQAFFCLDG